MINLNAKGFETDKYLLLMILAYRMMTIGDFVEVSSSTSFQISLTILQLTMIDHMP